MTNDFSKSLDARHVDPTVVAAESKSFTDFEQWMDTQLDLLVAQWIHTAAPNASRPSFLSNRRSSPAK